MNKLEVISELDYITRKYEKELQNLVKNFNLTIDEANLIQRALKDYFPVLRNKIVCCAKEDKNFSAEFIRRMHLNKWV